MLATHMRHVGVKRDDKICRLYFFALTSDVESSEVKLVYTNVVYNLPQYTDFIEIV